MLNADLLRAADALHLIFPHSVSERQRENARHCFTLTVISKLFSMRDGSTSSSTVFLWDAICDNIQSSNIKHFWPMLLIRNKFSGDSVNVGKVRLDNCLRGPAFPSALGVTTNCNFNWLDSGPVPSEASLNIPPLESSTNDWFRRWRTKAWMPFAAPRFG